MCQLAIARRTTKVTRPSCVCYLQSGARAMRPGSADRAHRRPIYRRVARFFTCGWSGDRAVEVHTRSVFRCRQRLYLHHHHRSRHQASSGRCSKIGDHLSCLVESLSGTRMVKKNANPKPSCPFCRWGSGPTGRLRCEKMSRSPFSIPHSPFSILHSPIERFLPRDNRWWNLPPSTQRHLDCNIFQFQSQPQTKVDPGHTRRRRRPMFARLRTGSGVGLHMSTAAGAVASNERRIDGSAKVLRRIRSRGRCVSRGLMACDDRTT